MNYVYYLFDSSDRLLYIGRTDCLRRRKSAFERRTGIQVYFGINQRHKCFADACHAELVAIEKHKPPYNKNIASVSGFLGKQHSAKTRTGISQKNKGRLTSDDVKTKISQALLGRAPTTGMTGKRMSPEAIAKLKNKVVSVQTKQKMSESGKKKVFTAEHRRNLSIAISKAKQCNSQHF